MRTAQFNKPLTIALPPELFKQIKKLSDRYKISIAQYCRECLGAMVEAETEQKGKVA